MFCPKEYEPINDRIGYLISQKSGITYIFSHYFAKIKVYSYDSLPTVKRLTLHVIINIKSVLTKDNNQYYYKSFLETCSYELPKIKHKFLCIV